MAWVADRAVIKLRDQIDEAAPGRSKASDGTIGDEAHQGTVSDHNPEDTADADAPGNPDGQVDAVDLTHDPRDNADMGTVTEAIRKSRDPRVKYAIFNRRIFHGTLDARRRGLTAYKWYAYNESDPHTNHAHVSVEDATHDQTQPWQIGIDAMPLSTADLAAIRKAVWKTDNTVDQFDGGPGGDANTGLQGQTPLLVAAANSVDILAKVNAPTPPLVVDAALLAQVMLRPDVVETYAKAIAAEIAELHFGVVTP